MNFLKRQSASCVSVNGGTKNSDFIKKIFICVLKVNESLMMTNDEWLRTEFNDLARTDVCPLVALFSLVSLSHSLDLSAVTPWARLLHKHHDWYPCVASQQTHSPLFRVVKACTIQSRGPHKHCNIMFSHTALIQNPFQSITLLKLAWGFCVLGGYSTQDPFRPAETHVSKPLQPADRGSVGTRRPDRGNRSLFRM